jgi:siroheme synthase-like protein
MFPLFLKLEGRNCLLVGAGRVAEAKLQSLLQSSAQVKVVAPKATPRIRRFAKLGAVVWKKREFRATDLEGMVLVVAATSSHRVNAAVRKAARACGVLCNAVDDPQNCDFYYPAIVRRGGLQVAISTGGASPELASRLRRELESYFGPEYGPWIDHLARRREELLTASIPAAKRRQLLHRMASRNAFAQFVRKSDRRDTSEPERQSATHSRDGLQFALRLWRGSNKAKNSTDC